MTRRHDPGGVARRPDGSIAQLILQHLAAHPAGEFTPMQLHRVLGASRGAIIRACQQLAAANQIRRIHDTPQRYQTIAVDPVDAEPATPTAAPTTPAGHVCEGEQQ